jgi:hypothetical protein
VTVSLHSGPCWKLFDMSGLLTLLILLFSVSSSIGQNLSEAREVYNRMMKAIEQINTCTFTISIEERVFDKYMKSRHQVKLQARPFKTYLKSEFPDKGAEVLYIAGSNHGKALINPNKFPFMNVNLLPTSSLLRKNHQYTVAQMGFGHLYSLLRGYERKEHENFFNKLHLSRDSEGELILEIRNHEFGYLNYKVMKGETLTSIAEKFLINDQMILALNPDCDYYDDVRPGQVISIPNSFGKRIIFHIDRKTGLPLKQTIYDDKGLFSKVEFSSFVLNPVLKENEFTKDFPGYGF